MKETKRQKSIEYGQQFNSDSAEMKVLLFEEERELHEAILKLDEKYRIPLILYYFQDLSYQQIADVLNISLSAVKTRLFRAKDGLKKVIANRMEVRAMENNEFEKRMELLKKSYERIPSSFDSEEVLRKIERNK